MIEVNEAQQIYTVKVGRIRMSLSIYFSTIVAVSRTREKGFVKK